MRSIIHGASSEDFGSNAADRPGADFRREKKLFAFQSSTALGTNPPARSRARTTVQKPRLGLLAWVPRSALFFSVFSRTRSERYGTAAVQQ